MSRDLNSLLLCCALVPAISGCHSVIYDAGIKQTTVKPSSPPSNLTREALVGGYQYCDGYWTWKIGLRENGEFTVEHLTDTGGAEVDEEGKWREVAGEEVAFLVENPDKTIQETKYRLCLLSDRIGLIEDPPRILAGRRYRRVYTKIDMPVLTEFPKQPPNHSPEPAPGAVH